jgi:hypothetical protein
LVAFPAVDATDVDECEGGGKVGVDRVGDRLLEVVVVGEPDSLGRCGRCGGGGCGTGEVDEGLSGDEFGRSVPTSAGFRIQLDFSWRSCGYVVGEVFVVVGL